MFDESGIFWTRGLGSYSFGGDYHVFCEGKLEMHLSAVFGVLHGTRGVYLWTIWNVFLFILIDSQAARAEPNAGARLHKTARS